MRCWQNHFQQASSTKSNLTWWIMQRFLLANAGESLAETALDIFWRSFQMSATVDFATPNYLPTTLCEAPFSRDCTISNFFPNVKTARFCFPRIPAIAVFAADSPKLIAHVTLLCCPVEGRDRIWGVQLREDWVYSGSTYSCTFSRMWITTK